VKLHAFVAVDKDIA